MSATDTISGARIDWPGVNWRQVIRCVRRLQVRIAEVVRTENNRDITGSLMGALEMLEPLAGKLA